MYHQNVKVKPESCHASGAYDLGRACCSRLRLMLHFDSTWLGAAHRLNSLEL